MPATLPNEPEDDLMEAPSNPEKVPKSYAAAAKGGKTQSLPHLLCVHLCTEEHTYIGEEIFSRVIDAMEKTILANQSEVVPEIWCSFKRWTGGRGLLSCINKETTDYLSQAVSKVEIEGKSFRAWPQWSMESLRGSLSIHFYLKTCRQGRL